MGKGDLLVRICVGAPGISRPILRSIYRAGAMPRRCDWIGQSIRRKIGAGKGKREVGLSYGLRMIVDLETALGQAIYFDGSYEPDLSAYLDQTLKPGMIAIDGGANVGELSLRMAKLVGPGGCVLAVEPSPETFDALKRNIAFNRLMNVRPICAALSEQEGTVTFHLGRDAYSLSSSVFEPADSGAKEVKARTCAIDELLKEQGLPRVDLIKLDVEGAELAALAGARECLNSAHRPVIIAEYNREVAARAGWNAADLISNLATRGYGVHALRSDGSLIDFQLGLDAKDDRFAKLDLVGIPG